MSDLKLMIEAIVMAKSQDKGGKAVGWVALDMAQAMLEMACVELEGDLSEAELRKVAAMTQVVATVRESLVGRHLDLV